MMDVWWLIVDGCDELMKLLLVVVLVCKVGTNFVDKKTNINNYKNGP